MDSESEKKKDFSLYYIMAFILGVVLFVILNIVYNIGTLFFKYAWKVIIKYWGILLIVLIFLLINRLRRKKRIDEIRKYSR